MVFCRAVLARTATAARRTFFGRAMSSAVTTKDARLVWVDCEMTGLDPDKDTLLEIAVIVTEGDLKIAAEGPDLVIHHPDSVLEAMGDWSRKHHGESGLTDAVRNSKIGLAAAEDQVLDFVKQHTVARKSPLAGNSIGQDARFLYKYMPRLMDHLHYRVVDVSTVKELARRWYPGVQAPAKAGKHRALDDIRESIQELEFYRKAVFKQ